MNTTNKNCYYETAKKDLKLRFCKKDLTMHCRDDILEAVNMMQSDGYMYILESNSRTKQLIITFEKQEKKGETNGE